MKHFLFGLLSCAIFLGSSAGCSTTDTFIGTVRSQLVSRPSLPLEEVADAFKAAKQLNPQLCLGFFTIFGFDATDESTSFDYDFALIDALKQEVLPERWQQPGCQAFRYGDWLVAFQTPDVIAAMTPWVNQACEAEVKRRGFVTTHFVILEVKDPDTVLGEIFGAELLAESSLAKQTLVSLTEQQREALLAHEKVTTLTAPQLSMLNGKGATATITTETAYVESFEHYYVDGAGIADPKVATLHDGISLDVRPVLSKDRKYCTIDLAVSIARLHDIEDIDIQLGDLDVTIQAPQMTTRSTEQQYTQPVGSSSCLILGNPRQRLLILSSVEIVPAKRSKE